MKNTPTVGIIGGGFCGMMSAVRLLRSGVAMHLVIINSGYPFVKGIAYSAHTEKYLLNVRAINMSAFDEEPQHFLDWLHTQHNYKHIARNILANVYVPRRVYGKYLGMVWQQAITNKPANTTVELIHQKATDILPAQNQYNILLDNGNTVTTTFVVLATGNTAPRELSVPNRNVLQSPQYFANPWAEACVTNVANLKSILIAGNGLTMIDTMQGLRENQFKGNIYTLSPNGFSLLPHKYNLLVYEKLVEELPATPTLSQVFSLVHKHTKALKAVGIGAHLVIDSLRPYTQKLWQTFSLDEKRRFLKKLSHKWTILRHRLPLHIFEEVQQQRIIGQMITFAGTVQDIMQTADQLTVTIFNRVAKANEQIIVDRIINCTGPEVNVCRSANELLRNLSAQGIIRPDALQLGIDADAATGAVVNMHGKISTTMFTIGGNLKGVLWESTAVPDLRVQARKLASHITSLIDDKKQEGRAQSIIYKPIENDIPVIQVFSHG